MSGLTSLQHEVIQVGLCTGCGNCVAVCPSKRLIFNYESEEPDAVAKCSSRCQLCFENCPGKDIPIPELEQMVFGRTRGSSEEMIGVCKDFFKSSAVDAEVREAGASGGFVSALLVYALEHDLIDGAVVASMSKEKPWRVVPAIATTRQEVIEAAQSKITIVPSNSILGEAVEKGFRKLGFVGLPCHVHAIRKMQLNGRPTRIVNSIKFTVGLLCGSNTTYRATEHTIEEVCAIPLSQVSRLEYRGGQYPGMFTVTTKDGRVEAITSPERRHFAMSYIRDRCNVCYDHSNELADVSAGDLFVPEAHRGTEGWTAVIVRSETGQNLVEGARAAGHIRTEPITVDHFFVSAGFENKKHGSVYRLLERKRHGYAVPDFHLPMVDYPKPWPRKVFMKHPHTTGIVPK